MLIDLEEINMMYENGMKCKRNAIDGGTETDHNAHQSDIMLHTQNTLKLVTCFVHTQITFTHRHRRTRGITIVS